MRRVTKEKIFMKKLLIICVLLFTTQGIAEEEVTKSCFRVEDISNWRALDNKRLIVWSPTQSHPYLVTLMYRCPGLTFEQSLIFKSTLLRTCSNSQDKIFIEDIPCYIKDIQKIDQETVQNLVIEIEGTES